MALRSQAIEYSHDGTLLEGMLAWDDVLPGPLPAVVVCHAWRGRGPFECKRAEALAGLGYAGFAADVYGKGVLGSGPEENARLMQPLLDDRGMLQGRLSAALEAVFGLPQVDAARVAVMGYCFGGLCALDVARMGAKVRGAISMHGLFHPPPNQPTSKIAAKVLALHGWDDPMVPPEQVVALARELTGAGADWQLHAYGHTMHAFTNPEANDPTAGTVYEPTADRRSWQAVENFLAEILN